MPSTLENFQSQKDSESQLVQKSSIPPSLPPFLLFSLLWGSFVVTPQSQLICILFQWRHSVSCINTFFPLLLQGAYWSQVKKQRETGLAQTSQVRLQIKLRKEMGNISGGSFFLIAATKQTVSVFCIIPVCVRIFIIQLRLTQEKGIDGKILVCTTL